MLHKYKYDGKNIVLDVNSGAVHIVDGITWEILEIMECEQGKNDDEIVQMLGKHDEASVREALAEIKELRKTKMLFSEDIFEGVQKTGKPVVKALCLHIAHDCNLKCKYCFAGEGEYHGARSLMPAETGMRALEFLVENSGSRRNLEVDFFGGEPTLNFEAVKRVVRHGRELEKTHSKRFRFTLTTNAHSLTDDMIDYCNENMSNVVLSIDGRKEVNDKMRPDRGGAGSYDKIVPNILKFVKKRGGENYYVRGTFTSHNLDFAEDALHLYNLGFKQISIEPVVAPGDADYAIRQEHVAVICEEYDKLTKIIMENGDLNFFHFNIDLEGGSCALKRISGCGAGFEYLAVTPDGSLYPCHQFAGLESFKLGNVYEGIKNYSLPNEFAALNVYTKEHCRDCWAKFYCSGGCAASSFHSSGDIGAQYELGCALQKKRVECAIYLKARNLWA